jgi:hypothetical protein
MSHNICSKSTVLSNLAKHIIAHRTSNSAAEFDKNKENINNELKTLGYCPDLVAVSRIDHDRMTLCRITLNDSQVLMCDISDRFGEPMIWYFTKPPGFGEKYVVTLQANVGDKMTQSIKDRLLAYGYKSSFHPAQWQDVGGPENGPKLVGHNDYTLWELEIPGKPSHCVVEEDGTIVAVEFDMVNPYECPF